MIFNQPMRKLQPPNFSQCEGVTDWERKDGDEQPGPADDAADGVNS